MSSTTIRTAALLFFATSPEDSDAALRVLEDERQKLASAPDGEVEVRLAVRMADDEMRELWRRTAHLRLETPEGSGDAYRVEDYPPAPFTAALLLTGQPGSLPLVLEAATGVANRVAGSIDLSSSAAVVGTEETVIPGEAAYVYLNNVRRRAGQSVEDFHDYWRLEHTKLSTRIPDFRGYRQVHAVGTESEAFGKATGLVVTDFDGVVEGYSNDIDDMVTQWTWEVENKLYEDEAMFTNMETCVMGYYQISAAQAPLQPTYSTKIKERHAL